MRAALLVLVAVATARADVLTIVAKPTGRVDRLGDPLPAKALTRFGSTRLFHSGFIEGVAAVGDYIASVGSGVGHRGPTVQFWDPQDGHLVAHATVEPAHHVAAAGGRMLVASAGAVTVFETVPKLAMRALPKFTEVVRGVALTPDGNTAALLLTPCRIDLVALDNSAPKRSIACSVLDQETIAISDSRMVAIGDRDGAITVFEPSGKVVLHHALPASAHSAAQLAFLGGDLIEANETRLARWDLATGKPRFERIERSRQQVLALATSRDGKSIAVAGTTLAVFDAATGAPRWSMPPPNHAHRAVAFGKGIVIVGTGDGPIELHDATTGARILLHPDTGEVIRSVAFADADRLLVLGEKLSIYTLSAPSAPPTTASSKRLSSVMIAPGRLQTWFVQDDQKMLSAVDAKTAKPTRALADRDGWLRAVSRDGAFLYTSEFGTFDRIATATMSPANLAQQPKEVECIAPGAGGAFTVVTNRGTIDKPSFAVMKWSGASGPTSSPLATKSDPIDCVEVDGDLVIATFDELLVLRRTGKLERFTRNVWKLVADPTRPRVALAGDGVALFDVKTGTITELGRHEGRVDALAFSPNGKLLATGGLDQSVLVWDVR